MINNQTLRVFLGINQFEELHTAWKKETAHVIPGNLSSIAIFFAVVVSLFPTLSYSYRELFTSVDGITVAVGAATCFAILFRFNAKIPFVSVTDWKRSLKLTHTAFAVGCIPLVALLLFYPEAFQVMARETVRVRGSGVTKPSTFETVMFVLKVAVWAGVTEEFIFRGMLISAIRRWRGLSSQRSRDLMAVFLSSFIFGFSHFFTWGPGLSIVVMGLGFGFGVAYIAIGEALLPLIVYHIIFDILSLSISLFV